MSEVDVEENIGSVQVTVAVLSGEIPEEVSVTVRVDTRNGTAIGTLL